MFAYAGCVRPCQLRGDPRSASTGEAAIGVSEIASSNGWGPRTFGSDKTALLGSAEVAPGTWDRSHSSRRFAAQRSRSRAERDLTARQPAWGAGLTSPFSHANTTTTKPKGMTHG